MRKIFGMEKPLDFYRMMKYNNPCRDLADVFVNVIITIKASKLLNY